MIIFIIAEIISKPNVPRIEQIQSTAAAQNILLALYHMGFGAFWRTGKHTSENNKSITKELNLSLKVRFWIIFMLERLALNPRRFLS